MGNYSETFGFSDKCYSQSQVSDAADLVVRAWHLASTEASLSKNTVKNMLFAFLVQKRHKTKTDKFAKKLLLDGKIFLTLVPTLPFADVSVSSFSIRDIHMANFFSDCSSRQSAWSRKAPSPQPALINHSTPSCRKQAWPWLLLSSHRCAGLSHLQYSLQGLLAGHPHSHSPYLLVCPAAALGYTAQKERA